ncbi:hypothetical protein RM533_07575 [Croceicoccus sp. F390]|uniref:Uncharacterized protein n=1 Tax=Croceicoccus esteveae TaxID=3075597 RepID=A0ABU2ZI16_9SPHN|nr:hypothetical protein [Croceicoccus sp. F390]MDT0576045.1 hypothetical protein [Croceicoccus sp. F390]
MVRRNPTSAEQTHAADNAPLNPRLLQAHGDARTKDAPVAPLASVSVKGRDYNIWPIIWLGTLVISILIVLIWLLG